ncbi:MAG: hypothetical protein U0Q03_02255 [Acidimicrobiales bacterium]
MSADVSSDGVVVPDDEVSSDGAVVSDPPEVVTGDDSSSSFLLQAPATSPSATSATTIRLVLPTRRLER